MAAVTICSNFGAQENKVSHCFPIYVPWSDGTRCHIYWLPSIYPPIWSAHHMWPASQPPLSPSPCRCPLHSTLDLTPCARPFSAWVLSHLAWVWMPQLTAPPQTYPLTPFDLWFHKTSHSLPYCSCLKSGLPKKKKLYIYIHTHTWTSQISGYDIFNKGLCKCNLGKDFKMRSLWMMEGLKPPNEHLYQRHKNNWQRHTQESGPREDGGRGRRDGSTSQGMSRGRRDGSTSQGMSGDAESQQKRGEVFGTVSHSVPPERSHPADSFILTFPSSRSVKECISDVLSHQVYGNL